MKQVPRLVLSSRQRAKLQRLSVSQAGHIAQRAKIILLAESGPKKKHLAQLAGVSRPTVDYWLKEFREGGIPRLSEDLPRSGRPKLMNSAVKEGIIETAKTQLRSTGKVSARSLAVACGVAHMTVWRACQGQNILQRGVTFNLSRDRAFLTRLRDVYAIYIRPPDFAIVLVVAKVGDQASMEESQKEEGLLKPSDLLNSRTFINRLHDPTELNSAIWRRFISRKEKTVLTDHIAEEACQSAILTGCLNRLIESGEVPRILGQQCSASTQASAQGVARDRRLLVEAFPSELPEFFDRQSKLPTRPCWTTNFVQFIREIASQLRRRCYDRGPAADFTNFVKEVAKQSRTDKLAKVEGHGRYEGDSRHVYDLWPIVPDWGDTSLAFADTLYPDEHELHIVSSGTDLFRKASVRRQGQKYQSIYLRSMPPGCNWFLRISDLFREIRRLQYPPTMFLRAQLIANSFPRAGSIGTGYTRILSRHVQAV